MIGMRMNFRPVAPLVYRIDHSFRRRNVLEEPEKEQSQPKKNEDSTNSMMKLDTSNQEVSSCCKPFASKRQALHMADPADVERMRMETKKLL